MSVGGAREAVLEIRDLRVSYSQGGEQRTVVHGVGLTVGRGETVAIVGESGSGKSTMAHAIAGLLPAGGRVEGGTIQFDGRSLLGLSDSQWGQVRGRRIGLVPQDPMTSLNPVLRIGTQVAEALQIHKQVPKDADVAEAVVALLAEVGLQNPDIVTRQFPHELSGGMRQRVLIAMGVACRPDLIIADEPTSALDVTIQRKILDRLAELSRDVGASLLLITHDLGVAAERAERIVVMRRGEIVEVGSPRDVLVHPRHEYTKSLVASAPSLTSRRLYSTASTPAQMEASAALPVLRVESVARAFHSRDAAGAPRVVTAVDDVSFSVQVGETVGLVGESGSGKSTLARLIMGLERPDAGGIVVDGQRTDELDGTAYRALRRRFQMVYQNPYSSLNPRHSVARIIGEPMKVFGIHDRAGRRAKVDDLLREVQLPVSLADRKPAALSGGQRQRVAIARALAIEPDLLVCDEPTSALDVGAQATILELLAELQQRRGLACLFISHDLAVVRQIAHRTLVMRRGRIVEAGATEVVMSRPQDPYTQELLASIPQPARRPQGA